MRVNTESSEAGGRTERPLVLIVDDNAMNLDLMVNILKDDYALKVATNGKQALAIVRDTPPDIVLLDIMMPGMDGYAVCRRLKSEPATKAIPVIFVTAKSQAGDEALGLEMGAVDYLTKPVSPAIVLARVKTHIALYDQNRALEAQVRRKTRQLVQSKELAEKASEAKSAFIANMSHELRTPLNHVSGLAELLETLDDDPGRLELIRPLRDGAAKLAGLFDQLLDLSLLESHAFEPEYREFRLLAYLTGQGEIFRRAAERSGLAFGLDVSEEVPDMVSGAPDAVGQVLINLFDNACRYTEHGEIRLGVDIDPERVAGLDMGTVMVRFTVSDTGPGIPEDKLETLFGSFEIGEKVLTKRLSGVGIGLSVARKLVRRLGGELTAANRSGGGSEFVFSLPFAVEQA